MKRTFIRCLMVGAMVVGLGAATSVPAQAQVQQAEVAVTAVAMVDPSCSTEVMGYQTWYFQMHDNFRCLGDWKKFGPINPTYTTACFNLSGMTTPAHPAPNGFSNVMSSGFNQTQHRLEFYDAFSCAGAVLFAMNPFTYRDTLVDAANNKASSVKIVKL